MKMMQKKTQANITDESFPYLVSRLKTEVEFIPDTAKPLVPAPWGKEGTPDIVFKKLLAALKEAGKYLPLVYQELYLKPLEDNLPSIIARANRSISVNDTPVTLQKQFSKTMEILGGAIYCHTIKKCLIPLRAFLCVISNTFQSFCPDPINRQEPMFLQESAPINKVYPPLATFRDGEIAPLMISSNSVKRLSGGTVGVVVMPATYMNHPLLWTAVAHEVGGHELMNAVPQILQELKKGVRQLFNVRSLRSGENPEDDQLIGLVWSYWAEETISDVCGVLNIGPAYGISLAIYQAALFHSVIKSRGLEADNTFLRLWSGPVTPQQAKILDDTVPLPDLDFHPTDILKLHVIIGAVENLSSLSQDYRQYYIDYFKKIARDCAGQQTEIFLCGSLNVGPDRWIRVKQPLPLEDMQEAARRVGAYIATAELNVLSRRSLQQLETWDDVDETNARYIAEQILKKNVPNLATMGDGAELLAASTLAFVLEPKRYEEFTNVIMNALADSCARDPYWGVSQFHSLIDLPDETLMLAATAQRAAGKGEGR